MVNDDQEPARRFWRDAFEAAKLLGLPEVEARRSADKQLDAQLRRIAHERTARRSKPHRKRKKRGEP